MFTRQLAALLADEINNTDMSGRSPADMVQRIERLRGCALLPRGRGKNLKHLSLAEVTAGILSVVTAQPGFAGVAFKVLMGLCPVGGIDASFQRCATFGKAMEAILSSPDALQSLIKVRVSDSEIATNSNGLAAIEYKEDDTIKTAYYIGSTAYSVLQPGAEKIFDPSKFFPIVTETIFYPSFFKRIDRELKRKLPESFIPLVDDEDEAEDRKEERERRLGIRRGSHFLNIGVDNQVDWPDKETVFEFEGHKLILMPKTKEHTTSIHIDLHGKKRISMEDAQTLINRFLSLMTWCDDQFAVAQGGGAGNPVPVAVHKRNLGFTATLHWVFNRKIPASPEARKAISIYREGRNAEENYLISYAVLAYYKIIELRYNSAAKAKIWLRDNFAALKQSNSLADTIAEFEKACGSKKPEEYLYSACRTVIAHANTPFSSDPDDFREIRRLHIAADILRPLARRFIKNELGVSDCDYDGS